MNKIELVFATHNRNKSEEVNKILGNDMFQIKDLNSIGISTEIEETGKTLEENARIKSDYVFKQTGKDVFSDDTGLEVYALDMEPGVYTARFAGPQCDANDNMDMLLKALENIDDRRARFRTSISLILNGQYHTFEGIVEGRIALDKLGEEGFGYDPIFIPESFDKTFAQISMEEKNRVSHRNRALKEMKLFLLHG